MKRSTTSRGAFAILVGPPAIRRLKPPATIVRLLGDEETNADKMGVAPCAADNSDGCGSVCACADYLAPLGLLIDAGLVIQGAKSRDCVAGRC
jgi:hypothetical protein